MNKDIDEKELEKAIKEIKSGKAPGPDCIINEIIKNAKELLLKPLCQAFNRIKKKEKNDQKPGEKEILSQYGRGKETYSK